MSFSKTSAISHFTQQKTNDETRRNSLEILWIHNVCAKLNFVISTSYRASFIYHNINKFSQFSALHNLFQVSNNFNYPCGLFGLVTAKAVISVVLAALFEEINHECDDLLQNLLSPQDNHLFSPLFPTMLWELFVIHSEFKNLLSITPFQSLRFKYDSESESSKKKFKRYSIGYNILSLFSLSASIVHIKSFDLMMLAAFLTSFLRKKQPSLIYFKSVTTPKSEISLLLKTITKSISICGHKTVITCLFPGWNVTENDIHDSFISLEIHYPDILTTDASVSTQSHSIPLFNVGKYPVVLMREIGHGTYSKVYEIKNPIDSPIVKDHSSFAYKVFRNSDFMDNYSLREVFTNTCLPHHPNITKLAAIFIDPFAKEYRLAFEMCLGDMMKLAQTTKPLDKHYVFKESISDFVYSVSSAIFHLHDNGFIHRDISPGNILISMDNTLNKLIFKISDFSLTRTINSSNKYSKIGFCLWYRPPEVLLNHLYSSLSDMWGIGCLIFFYAAKGVHLFKSNDEEDLKNVHMNWYSNHPLDQKLSNDAIKKQCGHHLFIKNTETESWLYNILSGLLTFDPTKRFSSKQLLTLISDQ
jgi:hypothetical protein